MWQGSHSMWPEDYMPQGSRYIQAEDCRGLATAFQQKDGSKCCNAASLQTGVNRRASVPVSHVLHLAVVLVSCFCQWARGRVCPVLCIGLYLWCPFLVAGPAKETASRAFQWAACMVYL